MTVRVQLFARARELACAATLEIELDGSASPTVGELRRRLALACPALTPLLANSAIAVDQEFADDSCPVRAGATIALLPPVSGGQ